MLCGLLWENGERDEISLSLCCAKTAPSEREPLAWWHSSRLKCKASGSASFALSGAPAPDSPFCRCATSSPGAGKVFPQRGSQGLRLVAKVLGTKRRFPAVLLALPLGELSPQVTERAHAVSLGTKVLSAVRKLSGAPERVQPYIITLYRQNKSQLGIDCGLYYPPESI